MSIIDPKNNKFLTINNDVVRTSVTDVVIAKLEKYFAQLKHCAKVTSVLRNPEQQLEVIKFYVKKGFIEREFPEINGCGVIDKFKIKGNEYYRWQRAWSRLLNRGIIINPPLVAACLFDYIKNGVNKKGTLIDRSIHQIGLAFDIGGSTNGVKDEVEIVSIAMASDPNLGIRGMIIERVNNCLHINCKLILK